MKLQFLSSNIVLYLAALFIWKHHSYLIAKIAPLSFQGSHRTQTQTSEVSSAARFSGHWVVTSMFA